MPTALTYTAAARTAKTSRLYYSAEGKLIKIENLDRLGRVVSTKVVK